MRWTLNKKQQETKDGQTVNVMVQCPSCMDDVRLEVWYNSEFDKATMPYHVKAAKARAANAIGKATMPPAAPMPANQEWRVTGSRVGVIHTVKVHGGAWTCTCQDHRIRKHDCKHILSKKAVVRQYAVGNP
jgi:hypothetical protein